MCELDNNNEAETPLEILETEEEPWSGTYASWMGAPIFMGVSVLVSWYDHSYTELAYKGSMWTAGVFSYCSLIWFHELIRGGPEEPDSLFTNYIGA